MHRCDDEVCEEMMKLCCCVVDDDERKEDERNKNWNEVRSYLRARKSGYHGFCLV